MGSTKKSCKPNLGGSLPHRSPILTLISFCKITIFVLHFYYPLHIFNINYILTRHFSFSQALTLQSDSRSRKRA